MLKQRTFKQQHQENQKEKTPLLGRDGLGNSAEVNAGEVEDHLHAAPGEVVPEKPRGEVEDQCRKTQRQNFREEPESLAVCTWVAPEPDYSQVHPSWLPKMPSHQEFFGDVEAHC